MLLRPLEAAGTSSPMKGAMAAQTVSASSRYGAAETPGNTIEVAPADRRRHRRRDFSSPVLALQDERARPDLWEERHDVDAVQAVHEHAHRPGGDRCSPEQGVLSGVRIGSPSETAPTRRLGKHVPVTIDHVAHHACPWVVEEFPPSPVGAPEEKARHAVGMSCRISDGRHPRVHAADERESVEAKRVGDRLEIPHHCFERVRIDLPSGETVTTTVEADELMPRGITFVPRAHRRNPPLHLAVGWWMTDVDDGIALTNRPERNANTVVRSTVSDPRLGHGALNSARICVRRPRSLASTV